MKLVIVLLFYVGVVLALNVDGNGNTMPGHVLLAKRVSQSLVSRFAEQLRLGGGLLGEGDIQPRGTLLPPNIPDPDCFGPGFIPINIIIPDPLIKIYGEVGVTSETKAYGFSRIQDDFNLTYTALNGSLKVAWDFGIPDIRLDGSYRMNLTIDLGTTRAVLGEGPLTGTVDTVFLTLRVNASAPALGKIGFHGLELDLGFSNFDLNGGEDATVGGIPIEWDRFSDNFQVYFDTIWNDETRPLVNGMITCSLEHLLNDCNILQLVSGETDCLKLEPNPECFSLTSNLLSVVVIDHVDEIQSFFDPYVVCSADTEPTSQDPETTTPSSGYLTLASKFLVIFAIGCVNYLR